MLPITVWLLYVTPFVTRMSRTPTVIHHPRPVRSYARDDDDHVRLRYNASVPSHNADDSRYRSLKTGMIIVSCLVSCLVNGASARAVVAGLEELAAAVLAARDPGGVAVACQCLAGFEAEQVHWVVEQVRGADVVRGRLVVAEDDRDVDLPGPQQIECHAGG